MDTKRFPLIIQEIYALVKELEEMFPGRRFTPDGYMVGSIGEALAKHHLGVNLFPTNTYRVDGEWNGQPVQIKTTQGSDTYLKKPDKNDLLLVLKLHKDGSHSVVYFNSAPRVWKSRKHIKMAKNGEKMISLLQLENLKELKLAE